MFDGRLIDPVFTGQPDGCDLGSGVLQLLLKERCGFLAAFALEVVRIADFDLGIVDPQIYQRRGFAADDDFVVSGMFQFRPEPSSHQ